MKSTITTILIKSFFAVVCVASLCATGCSRENAKASDVGTSANAKSAAKECVVRAPLPVMKPVLEIGGRGELDNVFFEPIECALKNGDAVPYKTAMFDGYAKAVSPSESINKIDVVEAEYLYIFTNFKKAMRISFWGANKAGFGYPFKKAPNVADKTEVDSNLKTLKFTRTYLLSDGKTAEFSWTAKLLGGNKVEVVWDSPSQAVSLWLVFSNFEKSKISFGGKPLTVHDAAFFKANGEKRQVSAVEGDMFVDNGVPTSSFGIGLCGIKGHVSEVFSQQKKTHGLLFRSDNLKKGRIVVDLGECYRPKIFDQSRKGAFFWLNDATHVNSTPCRNLLRNPSFESGARYWRGTGLLSLDYSKPEFEITSGGFDGNYALKVNKNGVVSLPMCLDSGADYILSFYARKSAPDCRMRAAVKNAGSRPRVKDVPLKNMWVSKSVSPTDNWTRHTISFKADNYGACVLFSGRNFLVDAVQLEKSAKESAFVKAPVEAVLTTSAKYNDLSFGDSFAAALEFSGVPNLAFNVRVAAKNAYFEELFSKDFSCKLGTDGKLKVPLDFDAKKFGCGIFCVRTDFQIDGVEPYVDYFRFSVMKKLTNTHATKNIFGGGMIFNVYPDAATVTRKMMEMGFGSTTWVNHAFGPDVAESIKKMKPLTDLLVKHRITNTVSGSNLGMAKLKCLTPEGRNLESYKGWETISDDQLKIVEQEAYLYIKNFPREIMGAFALTNEEEKQASQYPEVFAKGKAAFYRGAKRALPQVQILPTHGTCAYHFPSQHKAIDTYIELGKKYGVMFDGIGIHDYHAYDYDPNADLDNDLAYLQSRMKHYGFPDSAPIFLSECGNEGDLDIPLWRTVWADNYRSGKLTYDFGRQEIRKAFLFGRAQLTVLKHWPKVRSMNNWEFYPFIDSDYTPILLCQTHNTLGNLFDNVKFLGSLRSKIGVRGEVFTHLPDCTGIVAVWANELEVLRFKKAAPSIRVKFGQPVEFYDINGNPRAAPEVDADGYSNVPLTPAPLTIKAKSAKLLLKSLSEAVR